MEAGLAAPTAGSNGHPPSGIWTPDRRILASPTGITYGQTQGLSDEEMRTLHAWHAGKAGDDDGRPWWPAAVRSLPLHTRLHLASDPALDAAWERREVLRVQASMRYLLVGYGHMQDEDGGPPVPFLPWPEQLDVMRRMEAERLLIILKARQLGLTWLVLHEAVWGMGYDPGTPRYHVLALSKTLTDAKKLLARARRIVRLFPPYLRIAEDNETKRSAESFKLVGRGRMDSLPGTPDAARSEQADELILDEGAFYRNKGFRATWTAALSTIGRRGKARVISTGNGPPTAPGDGQGFAVLWTQARSGEDAVTGDQIGTVFLPATVDPRRDAAWRESERKKYLNPEDFESEHPLTEEQALAGISGIKVYLPAGINAAEALGRELDALYAQGRLTEPAGGLLEVCVDWGELTHILLVWPLEQGGMYVMEEYAPEAGPGIEPGRSTREILRKARDRQRIREPTGLRDPWPLIAAPRYDSAGVQSMKTFLATAEQDPMLVRQFDTRNRRGVRKIPTIAVSFADYKDLGKDYLKYLFRRVARGLPTGVIGISPQCPELLRQLRGLEVIDDGSGRIAKGDDHGPDALIADAVPPALRWLGRDEVPERELG